MQPDRRRQIVLAVLVVILAVVLYRAWPRSAGPAAGTSNPRSAARPGQATATAAPDVKLEALQAERPKPAGPTRNLFRFGRTERPRTEPPPVVTAPPTRPEAARANGAYGAADPAEVRRHDARRRQNHGGDERWKRPAAKPGVRIRRRHHPGAVPPRPRERRVDRDDLPRRPRTTDDSVFRIVRGAT